MHCHDAAEFLGLMGKEELTAMGTEAIRAIQEEIAFEGKEWDEYFESLAKDGEPTAYLFKCRHCGILGGYSDFT